MKRGPRRQRARLWAWLYLAIFGAGDGATAGAEDDSTERSDTLDDQSDSDASETN